MRTEVHFQSSAFGVAPPRQRHAVEPASPAGAVCRWIARELRERGFRTDDEPGREEFGWYVRFRVEGAEHFFIVDSRPGEGAGRWIGWVERAGCFRQLGGARKRGVSPRAVEAIDAILSSSPDVRSVSWHDG